MWFSHHSRPLRPEHPTHKKHSDGEIPARGDCFVQAKSCCGDKILYHIILYCQIYFWIIIFFPITLFWWRYLFQRLSTNMWYSRQMLTFKIKTSRIRWPCSSHPSKIHCIKYIYGKYLGLCSEQPPIKQHWDKQVNCLIDDGFLCSFVLSLVVEMQDWVHFHSWADRTLHRDSGRAAESPELCQSEPLLRVGGDHQPPAGEVTQGLQQRQN